MAKRTNGTGCAYKDKKTGKWMAIRNLGYDAEGKPIRKYKRGFATKKDAVLYLESLKDEKPTATVASLWETYHATSFLDLSAEKQRHYESVRDRLRPVWNKDISSLTILDLQRLIEPYSSFYAQKDIKTVMSHLYNIAIAQQMASVNLTSYMRLVSHKEKQGEAWSDEEVAQFWSAWNDGDEFVGYILFMIYTGCMPGELRKIRRDMIDYEKHEINGAGLKTETRKAAPLVLADRIEPVLRVLMSDSLVLWPYPKQKFYDEYHLCLARLQMRYLPPYSCRHTTATLVCSDTSALVAQKIMRHAQVSTTQRYVHPSSDDLREVVNKL